jgi:DNA repair protein RadC
MKRKLSLPVNCWAAEDIPSNKLIEANSDHLSNSELLSIIIGNGSNTENSVELARRILSTCDNKLSKLAKMTPNDLSCFHGVGKQKAAKIMAALELGRRRQEEQAIEKPDLGTAVRIYNMMHPIMADLEKEEFWVLLANQNFKLIKKFRLSQGGISEVAVDIRIVIKEAVLNNATILVVCHNHPSGSLRPSKFDDDLTFSLQKACQLMRIKFMDHVIVTDGAYYSYHEQGKL